MLRLSRRVKIILGFIVLVALGYGASLYWESRNGVPVAFMDAQSRGAVIAENIVSLSQQSNVTLEQVNADELKGNDKAALALVSRMVSDAQTMRNQAVDLSNQIQMMTRALSDIQSLDARQAALEAISSHLALINQLINYSGDLGNLLDRLRVRLSNGVPDNRSEIQGLVNQINTEVNAINNFNAQASRAMKQFNGIVSK